MTRSEAIKVLQTESIELGGNAVSVCRFLKALDMAVKALEDVTDKDVGKKMTNADRIRAMSDMEIAEASSFRFCPSEMIDKSCVFRNCKECWIEWLQQPAGEEDKHESN